MKKKTWTRRKKKQLINLALLLPATREKRQSTSMEAKESSYITHATMLLKKTKIKPIKEPSL